MTPATAPPPGPTHAYVGYNAAGKAVMAYVEADSTRRDCAAHCARIIRSGGYVERLPLADAQRIAADMFRGAPVHYVVTPGVGPLPEVTARCSLAHAIIGPGSTATPWLARPPESPAPTSQESGMSPARAAAERLRYVVREATLAVVASRLSALMDPTKQAQQSLILESMADDAASRVILNLALHGERP